MYGPTQYNNAQVIPLKGNFTEGIENIETLVNELSSTAQGRAKLKNIVTYALIASALSGSAGPLYAEEKVAKPIGNAAANVRFDMDLGKKTMPTVLEQYSSNQDTSKPNEDNKKSIWKNPWLYIAGGAGAALGIVAATKGGDKKTPVPCEGRTIC